MRLTKNLKYQQVILKEARPYFKHFFPTRNGIKCLVERSVIAEAKNGTKREQRRNKEH
jgi:hypothetical protein